ncbi:hypothetical protein L6452_08282 [Arctium lappa]|uniref:Uncharacterized protein n=1 Tax=Arctium lappa TaxID=4217 RepID=A0ACB9DHY0_ARCLA|nr:hypothetical protein L6452_08282 [Arctium lappa]
MKLMYILQEPQSLKEAVTGPRPYEHEVEKGSAFTLGLLAIKVGWMQEDYKHNQQDASKVLSIKILSCSNDVSVMLMSTDEDEKKKARLASYAMSEIYHKLAFATGVMIWSQVPLMSYMTGGAYPAHDVDMVCTRMLVSGTSDRFHPIPEVQPLWL